MLDGGRWIAELAYVAGGDVAADVVAVAVDAAAADDGAVVVADDDDDDDVVVAAVGVDGAYDEYKFGHELLTLKSNDVD